MLIIIAYYFLPGIRVNTAKYNCAESVCTHVYEWKRKGVANNGCWQQEGIWGSLRTIPIVSGVVDESQYSNDAYFHSVFYLQNVYLSSKLLITCILLYVLLVFCVAGWLFSIWATREALLIICCVCVSHSVMFFSTPCTAAHQASLSVGFSRQEYWSGLPSPSPEGLPDPDIEPRSPALQTGSLPYEPPGNLQLSTNYQLLTIMQPVHILC